MIDSVRTRLTLWYVGVLAATLILFSAGVYAMLSRNLHRRVDAALNGALESMSAALARETMEGESGFEAAKSTVEDLRLPNQAVAVFTLQGELLAEAPLAGRYHARLTNTKLLLSGGAVLFDSADQRVAGRRVHVAGLAGTSADFLAVASQPLEVVSQELDSLLRVFLISVPLTLLLAGFGGWYLARKSLGPVAAMSERARRITAENLEQRLPVVNPRDELGHLAETFNDLLARLDSSFARQRQFMADASHELRTPLSVIHTTAQVTLEKPHRHEAEYRDALRMIDGHTERLARIVDDMFTLARADDGRRPLHVAEFYLDELVSETAAAASILAGRKGVRVEVANVTETPYRGDEGLLRQMLLNLLENAIKHTSPGGLIHVGLERSGTNCQVVVADTGSGIPSEAQAYIFERFYRGDKARTRADGGGAGLGLSIAQWACEAHEGRLELTRSDESGSIFTASLPAS
jgi:two-component system, OmpR family, sensor kinase